MKTTPRQVADLSGQLHVSVSSLRALDCCWASEHHAWAIPMKGPDDSILGIRLRATDGRKWSVRGSHSGCFIPNRTSAATALVCEGFSDTAAGLDLGYNAVGRPAASGGIDHLKQLFKRRGVRKAVVLCDNDTVGVSGAKMFSQYCGVPNCLVILPCKDLRAYVQAGGDRALLDSLIQQSIWNQP
jgi:hypothetical protein